VSIGAAFTVSSADQQLRIRAEGFSDAEAIAAAPAMIHPETFTRAELTTWMTDAGPIDILFELRDRRGADVGFDSLRQRSVDQEIGGVVVHVAGLDDIIAAKEHADRDKDRQALPELRRLRDHLAGTD